VQASALFVGQFKVNLEAYGSVVSPCQPEFGLIGVNPELLHQPDKLSVTQTTFDLKIQRLCERHYKHILGRAEPSDHQTVVFHASNNTPGLR